jgi:hypothetical protein
MSWRPKPRPGVDPEALRLSPLEAHVLQRLDGQQDVDGLPALTGLGQDRLEELLSRLVQAGAVQAPEGEPEAAGADAEEQPAQVPLAGNKGPSDPMALYARELAPLAMEERARRAPLAGAAELSALCFDPAARVIIAALTNPRFGLVQARLVARHHRDAAGLEKLLATAAFAADAVVRQELLKNPQLQVPVLRHLWGGKRALELWKASTTREATEQARAAMKDLFRTRFGAAEAEERVEAILRTDGRCLPLLATVPVDGRTLSQLCARSYTSSLLVQNIARWGAAPTPLLAHLLRQPLVRQQRSLRQLVQQHPNAPSGVD